MAAIENSNLRIRLCVFIIIKRSFQVAANKE